MAPEQDDRDAVGPDPADPGQPGMTRTEQVASPEPAGRTPVAPLRPSEPAPSEFALSQAVQSQPSTALPLPSLPMIDLDGDVAFPQLPPADLASAFLAALDAIDDRRFVTPVPEEPALNTWLAPNAFPAADALPSPSPEPEPPFELVPFAAPLAALPEADQPSVAGLLTMGGAREEMDDASAAAMQQPWLEELGAGATALPSPSELSAIAPEPIAPAVIAEPAAVADSAIVAAPIEESATFAGSAIAEPPPVAAAPALVAAPAPVVEAEAEPEPDVLEDLEDFVVFSLGELRCVVPIRHVIEVGRIPEAAPVPNAPVWLHGLGNLRGQVVPLIDLRGFFGVGRVKTLTGRMVVLRAEADEVVAGVLVDQVHQIVALSPSRFHPAAASVLSERTAPYVWGACDYGNFTMLGLDVDGVLGVERASEEPAGDSVPV